MQKETECLFHYLPIFKCHIVLAKQMFYCYRRSAEMRTDEMPNGVCIFQLHQSANEKGPDAQSEALRQMLTQHMVGAPSHLLTTLYPGTSVFPLIFQEAKWLCNCRTGKLLQFEFQGYGFLSACI